MVGDFGACGELPACVMGETFGVSMALVLHLVFEVHLSDDALYDVLFRLCLILRVLSVAIGGRPGEGALSANV
jgi:hypothetical protein